VFCVEKPKNHKQMNLTSNQFKAQLIKNLDGFRKPDSGYPKFLSKMAAKTKLC
jgi:hypothetical protein